MESLDFVIDLTEKLEKQNIDYFLVALRKNDKHTKADVFYKLSDKQSGISMCKVLDSLPDKIEEDFPKRRNATNKKQKKRPAKKKSPAKKSAKKPSKNAPRKRGKPRNQNDGK